MDEHELQSSASVANCSAAPPVISLWSASRDACDIILFFRLSYAGATSGSQCSDVPPLFGRAARDSTEASATGSRARDLCFFKKIFSYLFRGPPPLPAALSTTALSAT